MPAVLFALRMPFNMQMPFGGLAEADFMVLLCNVSHDSAGRPRRNAWHDE